MSVIKLNNVIRKAQYRHINPSYLDRGHYRRRTTVFFNLIIKQ